MATAAPGVCTNGVADIVPVDMAQLRQGEASTSGRGSAHPGIARAATTLAAGDIVAIPTETVYGLAANALSSSAVSKIYAAKKRPADNPLIVHISSLDMLASLYPPDWTLPPIYEAVIRDLWPGPLTILLPRSSLVPDAVTCGLPTMAVRMPAHPVALALIAACGFPLAAPSANSSGRPSPTLARHVLTDLGARVPLILDGGACTCGVESTVLDGLRNPPAVLRPGGITSERLAAYPGLEGLLVYRRDFVDAQLEAAPSTPGMKYRHYSPTAPVLLLDPGDPPAGAVSDEELAARLSSAAAALLAELRGLTPAPARAAACGGVIASVTASEPRARDAKEQEQGCWLGGQGLQEQGGKQGHQRQEQGDVSERQRDLGGPQDGRLGRGAPPGQRVGVLRTSLGNLPSGPLRPLASGAAAGAASSAPAPATCGAAQHHSQPSAPVPAALSADGSGSHLAGPQQQPPACDGDNNDGDGGLGAGVQASRVMAGVPAGPEDHDRELYEQYDKDPQVYEYVLGHVSQPERVASELFAALRHLDEMGVAAIVVEGVRDSGAGVAVMNRLRKAASRVVPV